VLTLYITPVVYLYLDKVDRLLSRRLHPRVTALPEECRQSVIAAE
jgi:HAE1 family hydrophobic/amphiphilic exporter-1